MLSLRFIAVTAAVLSSAAAASALLAHSWVRRREQSAIASLLDALVYIAHRHRDYTVRNPNPEEPYINHSLRVAQCLAHADSGITLRVIIAGVLHNAIIDTRATRDELQTHFDSPTADIVAEVYDSHGNANDAKTMSKNARLVLVADYIENILDKARAGPLPSGSDQNQDNEFLTKAAHILDTVRGTNTHLELTYSEALKLYSNKFK